MKTDFVCFDNGAVSSTAQVQSFESNLSGMFLDYPDVLTITDLCRALSIGHNAAYKLVNTGAIKCIRVGRSIRIPKVYLIDYLRENWYNSNATTD